MAVFLLGQERPLHAFPDLAYLVACDVGTSLLCRN